MNPLNNNPPAVLNEEYLVTSADVDHTRKLKVSALVNMFIQIAWHHAEKLGFGTDFLHERGMVWVLSRLQLKLGWQSSWNEIIHASTWPKGIRRLFYLRDLLFTNQNGEEIVRGTSEWLMIDINARRPKLYQPENNVFKQNLDKHALAGEVEALEMPVSEPEIFERRVLYSDIDLNHHLTTVRYIDFMMDTFTPDFLASQPLKEIVLNFLHEIPYGTTFRIRRYNDKKGCNFFEFVAPSDNIVYFKGKLVL
jgi:medium-chain acyl-[acyl-carrier-protein] hydrolase